MEILATLHPDNNPNDDLFPNIKKENIPSKAINLSKQLNEELQKLGYNAEYMNWRNNIGGRNIVISVGLWHCTDSDSYKSSNDFIDCENDIEKFLEVASQKVINQ